MFVNITEMTRCEQHESLQNSQPLGKNAKLVLRIFDRKNLNLGLNLVPPENVEFQFLGKSIVALKVPKFMKNAENLPTSFTITSSPTAIEEDLFFVIASLSQNNPQ